MNKGSRGTARVFWLRYEDPGNDVLDDLMRINCKYFYSGLSKVPVVYEFADFDIIYVC